MEGKNWIIILEDFAKIDLKEIYNWYENEKKDLGEIFIDELELVFSKLKRNPFYASKLNDRTRGAGMRKFPYQIVYLVIEERKSINVIAISHQHRKPFWYKDRE